MAPDPDWRGSYKELNELLKSLGSRPAFSKWKSAWEDMEVRRCGSTKTQLYIPGQSDLDLVLYFPGREVSRPEQLELLRAVAEELRRHFAAVKRLRGPADVKLIEAKAPIVQFSMEGGLVVDMSVQSVLALANSTLVSRYCASSPELRLLARKVKEFANAYHVKSGKDGTLSSYGYTLLCIHFLQNAPLTGANVSVLPVFPGWQSDYGHTADRENADPNNKAGSWSWNKPLLDPYYTMADVMHGVMTTPEQSDKVFGRELQAHKVVHLFAHFATWLLQIIEGGLYAEETGVPPYVVSIRTRNQEEAWKAMAPRLDRRAFLAIEEPFSGENVARPMTYEGAIKLQRALQKAIQQLDEHPLARSLGASSSSLSSSLAQARSSSSAGFYLEDAYMGFSAH
jgi:hypothetical protein